MIKWILNAAAVLGIAFGSVATVEYWKSGVQLPTWVIVLAVLLIVFFFYAMFTAGLAWAETRGPSVEVGELLLDERVGMFYVVVTCKSPGHVKPTVTLTNAYDSLGRRLTTSSPTAHWRDKRPGYETVFEVEGANAEAGLIGIFLHDSGNRYPHYWDKDHKIDFLDPKVPWDRRDRIRLEVRVKCALVRVDPENGKLTVLEDGEQIDKTYYIAPDETKKCGYNVVT